MCLEFVYMFKKDLALNNLQWLICHKTKPNQSQSEIGVWSPLIFVGVQKESRERQVDAIYL